MKRKANFWLGLLLLAVPAVMSFASGGSQSSGTSTLGVSARSSVEWNRKTKDKVVVSVINPYYTAGWQAIGQEYMKLYPETEVVVDIVAGNDEYQQKIMTWSASGLTDAADIVHINFAEVPLGGREKMWSDKIIYDFTADLDKANPYLPGNAAWSSVLDSTDVQLNKQDRGLWAMPFDKVGVAVIYNKTLLDKNGIAVPKTLEQWLAACEKLKASGTVRYPIAASGEAEWYISGLADAAMRSREYDFLVQPGDALWSTLTEANRNFRFDENNWASDQFTVFSRERVLKYLSETDMTDSLIPLVWNEFARLGKYFNESFESTASTEVLTSFEMGNAAFLFSGSWNVGALNKDIKEMGSRSFEWGTFGFLPYENPPAGFQAKLRTLYGNGNTMGIIITHPNNNDHLSRVVDFYKFAYTPKGAQVMYEATLNAGHFVQGPAAIKGVTLDPQLNAKLEGFIQPGAVKSDFATFMGAGEGMRLQSDVGTYYENVNNLVAGKIDAATFVRDTRPLWKRAYENTIYTSGFDLDPKTADVPPR
jgi:ABC-type glycerol-3-phosphate transport system substrate-binding protein